SCSGGKTAACDKPPYNREDISGSPGSRGLSADEGAQPAQKRMLDEFMEKYNLQDQDWRKQMKKK
ncbi:MAG: hypothetical protein ACE5FE_06500, partial [Acidiferrobacterales bacterium]